MSRNPRFDRPWCGARVPRRGRTRRERRDRLWRASDAELCSKLADAEGATRSASTSAATACGWRRSHWTRRRVQARSPPPAPTSPAHVRTRPRRPAHFFIDTIRDLLAQGNFHGRAARPRAARGVDVHPAPAHAQARRRGRRRPCRGRPRQAADRPSHALLRHLDRRRGVPGPGTEKRSHRDGGRAGDGQPASSPPPPKPSSTSSA